MAESDINMDLVVEGFQKMQETMQNFANSLALAGNSFDKFSQICNDTNKEFDKLKFELDTQMSNGVSFGSNPLLGDEKSFEGQIFDHLLTRLESFEFESHKVDLKHKDSLWKVSSALQKCIRRGYVDLAQKYAQAILNTPECSYYFWSRLPVIALEDVGIADIRLCACVLFACQAKAVRTKLGEYRLAMYLVRALASSLKSRSLTDVLCWVMNSRADSKSEILWSNTASTDEMLQIIWSPFQGEFDQVAKEVLARSILVARLLGDREYEKENDQPVDKEKLENQRLEFLTSCAPHLNSYEQYVLLKSLKAKVHDLHHGLPMLAWLYIQCQMTWKVRVRSVEEKPFMIAGVPEWAFDQHVSTGKAAIAYYMKADSFISNLFPEKTVQDRAALGMAIFQVESALLDRQLTNAVLDEIQRVQDELELQTVGLYEIQSEDLLTRLSELDSKMHLRYSRWKVNGGTATISGTMMPKNDLIVFGGLDPSQVTKVPRFYSSLPENAEWGSLAETPDGVKVLHVTKGWILACDSDDPTLKIF